MHNYSLDDHLLNYFINGDVPYVGDRVRVLTLEGIVKKVSKGPFGQSDNYFYEIDVGEVSPIKLKLDQINLVSRCDQTENLLASKDLIFIGNFIQLLNSTDIYIVYSVERNGSSLVYDSIKTPLGDLKLNTLKKKNDEKKVSQYLKENYLNLKNKVLLDKNIKKVLSFYDLD